MIIRKACSRELTDLGLIFNSLNIKVVQSEVAESRRRQSAAEAQANADIVTAQQARRAKDAQLEAERAISDKQRELEQTKAANAALIAEAKRRCSRDGYSTRSRAEATQIAQARADAERLTIDAEARAKAEAIRITTVAQANAESIQKVNEAIKAGGESYFRYRQIEMIPEIAPVIADALAKARLVTISGDSAEGGAAQSLRATSGVIQNGVAAQLVSSSGMFPSARRRVTPPRRTGARQRPRRRRCPSRRNLRPRVASGKPWRSARRVAEFHPSSASGGRSFKW